MNQESLHQEVSVRLLNVLLDDVLHTTGTESLQICMKQNLGDGFGEMALEAPLLNLTQLSCADKIVTDDSVIGEIKRK